MTPFASAMGDAGRDAQSREGLGRPVPSNPPGAIGLAAICAPRNVPMDPTSGLVRGAVRSDGSPNLGALNASMGIIVLRIACHPRETET